VHPATLDEELEEDRCRLLIRPDGVVSDGRRNGDGRILRGIVPLIGLIVRLCGLAIGERRHVREAGRSLRCASPHGVTSKSTAVARMVIAGSLISTSQSPFDSMRDAAW
jgi:hypothetical protein